MEYDPIPVSGYKPQSQETVDLVNFNKEEEERTLRRLDELSHQEVDLRWLAIGRTHLELAYMAINRSIFKPDRVSLPIDEKPLNEEEIPF